VSPGVFVPVVGCAVGIVAGCLGPLPTEPNLFRAIVLGTEIKCSVNPGDGLARRVARPLSWRPVLISSSLQRTRIMIMPLREAD